MTGNELDIAMRVNPPWNPSESIGAWLRGTGENVAKLREALTSAQSELEQSKKSRARLVQAMSELQAILGLPHADPAKIVKEVIKRIGGA